MPQPQKLIINDQPVHASVGAVIVRGRQYLLIDRATPPLGLASVAGHIDENEKPEQALVREVQEESGKIRVSYDVARD